MPFFHGRGNLLAWTESSWDKRGWGAEVGRPVTAPQSLPKQWERCCRLGYLEKQSNWQQPAATDHKSMRKRRDLTPSQLLLRLRSLCWDNLELALCAQLPCIPKLLKRWKISLRKKIPSVKFEAAVVKKQMQIPQTITANAEYEELPGKRRVLRFEFHCTSYQDSEVSDGFSGQTTFRKTKAFFQNILPVLSWKIYTTQSIDFLNTTALLRNSPKLEPSPTRGTWLFVIGGKRYLKEDLNRPNCCHISVCQMN